MVFWRASHVAADAESVWQSRDPADLTAKIIRGSCRKQRHGSSVAHRLGRGEGVHLSLTSSSIMRLKRWRGQGRWTRGVSQSARPSRRPTQTTVTQSSVIAAASSRSLELSTSVVHQSKQCNYYCYYYYYDSYFPARTAYCNITGYYGVLMKDNHFISINMKRELPGDGRFLSQ